MKKDNNHIVIYSDKNCCGCRACEAICPEKAISMRMNNEGFLYPYVDKSLCINCGICKKKCQMLNKLDISKEKTMPKCYAVINKSKEIQKESTSGGMFRVLADFVLDNNGVVCGSVLDENMQVKHVMARKIEEVKKMMGSKYVYSDPQNIYSKVKKELDKGVMVLFTGTPCQVAAMKLFLPKKYSNLITTDIICHGTPNQELFNKYITYLEKKFHAKVLNYEFRSKKYVKWGGYVANVVLKNRKGEIKERAICSDLDKYYSSFLKSKNYRESCYECLYANGNRVSDFTIGDFWGIEKVFNDMHDDYGVSAVMINSSKALEVFNKIKGQVKFKEVFLDEISKENKQLNHPSIRPTVRDTWYNDFNNEKFIKNIKIENEMKLYIKSLIPTTIKNKIKKLWR